jgi:hypothetical protein
MKRKSGTVRVEKSSISMAPALWAFTDAEAEREGHNSRSAFIADLVRTRRRERDLVALRLGALLSGQPPAGNDAAPIGTPTQVLNLVLTEGDFEGTLDAAWDRVRGASSYEIQISVDPITPTSWAFKQSASKSSATISGLTSGAKLWVHARAIGAGNTPGPWSDLATKIVP